MGTEQKISKEEQETGFAVTLVTSYLPSVSTSLKSKVRRSLPTLALVE